jgi:hypothetical protein
VRLLSRFKSSLLRPESLVSISGTSKSCILVANFR